jgi:hypothetical protein
MVRSKKKPKFRSVSAVKRLARERIGTPPPSRIATEKKTKTREKHRPTLSRLLDEMDQP